MRRRHQPIPEQGEWLASVLRGHANYYGVPHNRDALLAFRFFATEHWYRALRRRSLDRRPTVISWGRGELLSEPPRPFGQAGDVLVDGQIVDGARRVRAKGGVVVGRQLVQQRSHAGVQDAVDLVLVGAAQGVQADAREDQRHVSPDVGVSVARMIGGNDDGAFRVEVEDVGLHSGGSDPQDGWFTIVLF